MSRGSHDPSRGSLRSPGGARLRRGGSFAPWPVRAGGAIVGWRAGRTGTMIRREDSLEYHGGARPGKIELHASKPCLTPREMSLAYLPGAAFPSRAIADDPAAAFRYTARGNLVGVVTNGTAVPGLGCVGPLAAKPMQEGIAVLFKRLADIDVFDLEIDAPDPESFVQTVLR